MKDRILAEKTSIWCLVLIAGVVSVPLMTDYYLAGSSLTATLSQIQVISQGIGKVFPIRLGPLGSMDYGYSAASFQANLFYLFPAMLHLLGMDLGDTYKWTLFLLNLATSVTAYLCFRRICGRRDAGLIGSMLYTWCPYRCSEMYLVGDLGELAAWTFPPVVLLGLWYLYAEDDRRDNKKAWVLLAWGFSLTAVSSTVVLIAMTVMTLVILLAMGKRTFQKPRLLELGKAAAAIVSINAWFLVPALLRLRDVSAVGAMLLPDVRSRGMYLAQYLTIFSWGKDGVELLQNGLRGAQAMGPGIAVILLAAFWIWMAFTGQSNKNKEPFVQNSHFIARLLCACAVLMLLGSNIFPWDLLQDRNMLCSIVLALLYTPAKLGIAADICLILAACIFLPMLAQKAGEKNYRWILLAVTAISFGTTQFLLGNILITRPFFRKEDLNAMELLPFSLLTQESIIWRLCESVSVITLFTCVALLVIKRRKSAKQS